MWEKFVGKKGEYKRNEEGRRRRRFKEECRDEELKNSKESKGNIRERGMRREGGGGELKRNAVGKEE